MKRFYHRFLSSILSFSLLLQVVWIPGVFARQIDEGVVSNRVTPEQLATEQLENEESVDIWKQIYYQAERITGNESEDMRIRYYFEQETDSESYDKEIAKNYTNSKNWSLKTYLQLYYTNEDKRNRIPLVWGFFDGGVNFLSFSIDPVQNVIKDTTTLAEKVTTFLKIDSISDSDKIIIISMYMQKVFGPLLAVISLFSDDPTSLSARMEASRNIQIKVHYDLYNKFEENFKQIGITRNKSHQSKYWYQLTFSPRYLLKMLIIANLEIPSSHFYVSAARLQTLHNMVARNDYYKLTLKDEDPTIMPISCQQTIGIDFPTSIQTEIVDEETRKDYMNSLLSDNGLLLYKGTQEGSIQYSTYEDYYRYYTAPSTSYYNAGFSGLLPYEDYFSSQHALENKTYDYGKDKRAAHLRGNSQRYARPQVNDVEHFTEVLSGKGYQIEQYLTKEAKIKEKDMTVYNNILRREAISDLENELENATDPITRKIIKNELEFDLQAGQHQSDPQAAPYNSSYYGYSYREMALNAAKEGYEKITLLQEGIVQAEEIWKQMANFNIENYTLYPDDDDKKTTLVLQGINQYLATKMITQEVGEVYMVVPEYIVERLKENVYEISMPHINAPDAWRKWAMQIMLDFINNHIDGDTSNIETKEAHEAFTGACRMFIQEEGYYPAVCTDGMDSKPGRIRATPTQIMSNLKNIIVDDSDYIQGDDGEGGIFPRLSYDLDLLHSFYPLLQRVWRIARIKNILPQATTNEWTYIISQLPYNGWAILRITHLLLEDEFETTNKYNEQAIKHYRHIAKILKTDTTLKPFHSSSILNANEHKAFWGGIASTTDKNNLYIFRAINEQNDRPYYEILRNINDAYLFDPQALDKAKSLLGNNINRSDLNDELNEILNSKDADEINYLNKMYANIEDTDTLFDMAEEYFELFPKTATENEIVESDESLYVDVISRFLKHESNLKKPLYHHALKEAAYLKLQETEPVMDQLCKYIPFKKKGERDDDYRDAAIFQSNALSEYLQKKTKTNYSYGVPREDYNDLFDVTSAAHSELKQEYQIQIPMWAQKFADRLLQSKEDVMAMGWALGSAVLYMISIPLTNGATLGLAPHVASAIGAILPIAAAGLEFFSGGICEIGVIIDAKERTATREQFAAFGTMSDETQIGVDYSYIWVMLEFAFFSQLLGAVDKGIKLFTRTMYATKRGAFKGLTHIQKLAKYRGIARRVSTSSARAVLNINRRLMKNFGDDWFKNGLKALKFEYLRGFKGAITPAKANSQLATVMARFFDNSTDQFIDFFKHVPKKKYSKLQSKLQTLVEGSTKYKTVKAKMLKHKKTFETAKKIMDGAAKITDGANLERYILDNINEVCDTAMTLGWKDWFPGIELPYHVLITGMPAGNRRLPILRNMVTSVPMLATANDRILIQRMISARNILISDHNVRMAARVLGFTAGDPTKFKLRKAFDRMVEEAINLKAINDSPEAVSDIRKLVSQFETQQAEGVISHFKRFHPGNFITKITPHEFQTLLKSGNAQAIAAFNKTRADTLFGLKITQDTAFEIIQQLTKSGAAKNTTKQQFEILVNALKLRSIAINPRKFFPELKYTI